MLPLTLAEYCSDRRNSFFWGIEYNSSMNQLNIEIGKRVREYRKAAKLTQEQLAAYSGLTNDYLSRLELGKENPSVNTLVKICEALNIEVALLFYDPE